MTSKHITMAKLLLGALAAIVPACLGYCKAAQENQLAARESDAGYKALVQSVRNLEQVVQAQGNAIAIIAGVPAAGSAAAGSGVSYDITPPREVYRLPEGGHQFAPLPESPAAALRQQAAN